MTGHVCVVLAKGNSRRLLHKNRVVFDGKSLPRRAVDCAKATGLFDRIILDTDAREIGYDFKDVEVNWRGKEVCGDDIPSAEVILAIPNIADSQTITLLQPTSPLRTSGDVAKCIELLSNDSMAESVVSVVRVKEARRIFRMSGYLQKVAEDEQTCCVTNGAIWCIRTPILFRRRTFITEKTAFYEMPKERSVDIDTRDDFLHALALWEKGYGKK